MNCHANLQGSLELYDRPVDNVGFAHDLHIVSKDHYGLAREQFIKYIIKNANERCAKPDSRPYYGKVEKGKVYIIPNVLQQALKENG